MTDRGKSKLDSWEICSFLAQGCSTA